MPGSSSRSSSITSSRIPPAAAATTHDFHPRYGVHYADVRVVEQTRTAAPLSTNVVVLCPNHDAIIGATNASFDRRALMLRYPNGLEERLILREHLLVA